MVIAGLQKMTLLDYPGKVACTVFLQGCNFRCPFCHNSDLLGKDGPEPIPEETLLAFLKKRVGLLDAVCVTGGEPTLQKDLRLLLEKIKALGYLVKLDTNGGKPEVLKELVEAGLVDYVAMDIKNCPARYGETAGVPKMDLTPIEQSMRYLLSGAVDFEFRTTVADELHGEAEVQAIGQWLEALSPEQKCPKFFLQPYVDRESVLVGGLHSPAAEKLRKMAETLKPYAQAVSIRALD
jgi:pyruvate formate lyase activating enzyme